MSAERWVIRYRYPGTVSGRPVGWVYALHLPEIGPGVWSYTTERDAATTFDSEAEAERVGHHMWWPNATAVRCD